MSDLLEIQTEAVLQQTVQEVVLLEPAGSDDMLEVPTEQVLLQPSDNNTLLEPVETLVLLTEAQQGPPGPQGIPGPDGGQALQRIAAEQLSALRAVHERPDGRVAASSASDDSHVTALLGVSLTAAEAGAAVNVQRSGVIDDSGWSWVPGARVYLGQLGAITQAPANSGFDVLIGVALSATRLLLNLQDPIELE